MRPIQVRRFSNYYCNMCIPAYTIIYSYTVRTFRRRRRVCTKCGYIILQSSEVSSAYAYGYVILFDGKRCEPSIDATAVQVWCTAVQHCSSHSWITMYTATAPDLLKLYYIGTKVLNTRRIPPRVIRSRERRVAMTGRARQSYRLCTYMYICIHDTRIIFMYI